MIQQHEYLSRREFVIVRQNVTHITNTADRMIQKNM